MIHKAEANLFDIISYNYNTSNNGDEKLKYRNIEIRGAQFGPDPLADTPIRPRLIYIAQLGMTTKKENGGISPKFGYLAYIKSNGGTNLSVIINVAKVC